MSKATLKFPHYDQDTDEYLGDTSFIVGCDGSLEIHLPPDSDTASLRIEPYEMNAIMEFCRSWGGQGCPDQGAPEEPPQDWADGGLPE